MEGKYISKEEMSATAEYIKQRNEEISLYLRSLLDQKIAVTIKKKNARRLEFLLLLTWLVATVFGSVALILAAQLVFWFYFMFNLSTLYMEDRELDGKLDGAFKILELLHMIPETEPPAKKRRKRLKLKNPFAGLTQAWERAKQKLRKEAYV